MRRWLPVLAWIAAGLAMPAGSRAEVAVDVELVLAVDVSGSMDASEHQVQRQGYETAMVHPDVLDAIRGGMTGRIAVTYVEWAGPGLQRVIVPWMMIDGAESAQLFVDRLRARPISQIRGTSISGMLLLAPSLFEDNGFEGLSRVVDISGDGPNNRGRRVDVVRDSVVAEGITINGLPVLLNPSGRGTLGFEGLVRYYEDCVIGGFGAFVLGVNDPDHLADAIRRKLVLEIAGASPPRAPSMPGPIPAQAEGEPMNCRIGEIMRRRGDF